MKTLLIALAVGLLGVSGAARAGTHKLPKETVVKTINLQAFFHTPKPWLMRIYQPVWGDGPTVWHPLRACFTGRALNQSTSQTQCTPLYVGFAPGIGRYPCQRFESAKLEVLSGPAGKLGRQSLVIHARYASGTNGQLQCVFVWNFDNLKKKFPNNPGWFFLSFQSDTNQTGAQKFITSGPLAGAFVRVEQLWQPADGESSMESPMRFQIDVYEPSSVGYMKVLSMLSENKFPSNNSDRGTPHPIEMLTPQIVRALRSVYPHGVSSVLGH